MNPAEGHAARQRVLLFCLLFFVVGGTSSVLSSQVQALRVGNPGLLLRVSSGDLFTLRYTHSMYGVEVEEKFRVGSGVFTLFHVRSSAAALEYFGIERSESGNAVRDLDAFSIPTASTGNHRLLLKDRDLQIRALAGSRDSVPVRLVHLTLFNYLFHPLWR
jgi:hypothetical protein